MNGFVSHSRMHLLPVVSFSLGDCKWKSSGTLDGPAAEAIVNIVDMHRHPTDASPSRAKKYSGFFDVDAPPQSCRLQALHAAALASARCRERASLGDSTVVFSVLGRDGYDHTGLPWPAVYRAAVGMVCLTQGHENSPRCADTCHPFRTSVLRHQVQAWVHPPPPLSLAFRRKG